MTTPNSTLRKAAILIASLDETTARRLLNQMGPTQAARVRDAVAALDQINPIEQEQVISEFFRHNPPSAAPIERGVELAGSLSRHSQADDHEDDHDHDTNNRGDDDHVGHGMDDATYTAIPSIGSAVAGEPANKPFRFLHGAKAEIVTPYLEREHPQTIAVVLSHLPAEKAADVLGKFSQSLQVDVMRRLAILEEADPEVVREVEQSLERWVTEQTILHQRREAGLVAVGNILRASGTGSRELLANLAKHDRAFAEIVLGDPPAPQSTTAHKSTTSPQTTVLPLSQARLVNLKLNRREPKLPDLPPPAETWSFSDLIRLSDADLATVFHTAGTELTLLALKGAPTTIVERVVSRLPRREAKVFRKSLNEMGPTRLRDVDHAQRELAATAHRLADEGAIDAHAMRPQAA